MQIQKVIEQLGFTAKEAKIYLATLHLGEAHITDIADMVKMPLSTVQLIVKRLYSEGLLNYYVMRRYKYWIAENPEKLLTNLRKRESLIQEALPQLIAIKKASIGKRLKVRDINTKLGPLRVVADESAQPVLITDENIKIVYVNSEWEKQFGYSFEDVVGQNPRILQSGKTPKDVYKRMWESLRAGKMFQSDKIIDQRKDGTLFNLLTAIFSIKHHGRTFYIQMLNDITEQKQTEALQEKFLEYSK